MRKKLLSILFAGSCFFLKAQLPCQPTFTFGCAGDGMVNVQIGNLNNSSSDCNPPSQYNNFTSLAPANTIQGATVPLSITNGSYNSNYYNNVWIDFDNDSIFSDSERVITNFSIQGPGTVGSTNIIIPTNANTGNHLIRVLHNYFSLVSNPQACDSASYSYGECEDYTINIAAAIPCAGSPVAGLSISSDTLICPASNVNFSLSGNVLAGGLSYQWQTATSLGGPYANISGATGQFYPTDSITSPGYFQCVITCLNSSLSSTSTPVYVNVKPFLQCYCTISSTNNFGTDIGNVTVGAFSNGTASPIISNVSANNTYTDFTGLPAIPLLSGIPNPIQFTGITAFSFVSFTTLEGKVFIDYNHDGIYDPITELAFAGTGNYNALNSSVISGSPLIPSSALTGLTGMRVMLYEGLFPDACNTFGNSGETEDYIVDIQPALACTGLPTPGNAITSDTLICPSTPISLSLQGSGFAFGISYQWQSSPTLSGPYSNIANATNFSYPTDSVITPTYFHCVVTCASSSLSAISAPVFVNVKSFTQCYCNTNLGGNCSPGANNISFNSLNNPSIACNNSSGQAYVLYPDSANFTTTLIKGVTYPFSLTTSGTTADQITVYIDYNHDGIFTNGTESINVVLGNVSGQTSFTVPITIPLTADTSKTVMRVRVRAVTFFDACENFGSGETEDYIVNIIDGVPCSGAPNPGLAVTSDTSVCLGSVANFSLSGASQLSGLTYQWQENGVNIAGAINSVLSDTVTGPSTYQCIVTCSNTTSSATSTAVTLTINPFSLCYCSIASSNPFGTDIGNVTVGGFSNGTAAPIIGNLSAANTYTSYTNLAPIPLLSSIPNGIQMTGITSSTFVGFTTLTGKVFIDYNQDGIYNPATELAFTGTGNYTSANGSVITGNPVIPASALSGVTGMRVMLYEGFTSDACNTFGNSGETEDYLVDIQPAIPCAGTPVAGSAAANDTNVCLGTVVNFSLSGSTLGSGLTYQWQLNGVNLPGDTNLFLSDTITGPNTYQCVVTCSNSGASVTSTPLTLSINPFSLCYCEIVSSNTFGTDIGNVTVGGVSNGSATPITGNIAAVNTYTSYTSLTPIPLLSSIPNSIQMTGITSSTFVGFTTLTGKVFIDYNQDGTYDPITELAFSGTGNYTAANGSVIAGNPVIPATALPGITGMRVMLYEGFFPDACITFGNSGETEDYLVDIQPAVPCSGSPVAGNATTTDSLICPNTPVNLNLQGSTLASGISYQWQSSNSLSGPYTNVLNATNLLYPNDSVSSATYFQCLVTCISSGSSVASVPVFVDVNPANQCYCVTNLGGFCTSVPIDAFAIFQRNGATLLSTTLNNQSNGCVTGVGGQAYSAYGFNSGQYATLAPTDSFKISVTNSIGIPTEVKVWTDWNKDGIWNNTNELTTVCTTCVAGVNTANFSIDPSASVGDTVRMRVRTRAFIITDACQNMGSGETEDYWCIIGSSTLLTLGKAPILVNAKVKVYPNPTTGILNYELPENAKSVNISVLDVLGRVLISKAANNKSIDLSELKNGSYYISMNVDGKVFQSKVVLNK
jgi:nitrogen regulatory protein PII-like uncharacterized protein